MVLTIHNFMLNAEEVSGIFTIRAEEFCLFKHVLQISDVATRNLFVVIRQKKRTLCWKQFHRYMKFLLIMKYRTRFAIHNAVRREDKTISKDALQGELGIPRDSEAVWLFDKVQKYHDTTLTWKQCTEYLQKSLSVKNNMADFFDDMRRDEEYEERKAEKIQCIGNGQMEMLDQLESIRKLCGMDTEPLESLRNVLNEHAQDGRMAFDEFKLFFATAFKICISAQLWRYLLLEQNTEMNGNVNLSPSMPRAGQSLEIEFLISRMRENVRHHRSLSLKQVVKVAFAEFRINANQKASPSNLGRSPSYGDGAENGAPNMADVLQEMQTMQKQWKQQHQMLLREMHAIKQRLPSAKLNEAQSSDVDLIG